VLVPEVSGAELVPWLRGVIGRRLALARYLVSVQAEVESGVIAVPAERPPASPRWHEQSSGVLWTGEGDEEDAWHGTWPMGDSRLTRFIADNDPETVIAGCEMELAVLDLHERTAEIATTPPERWATSGLDRPPQPSMVSAQDYLDAQRELAVLVHVVRLLGYSYRFKDGYRDEWRP